MVFASQTFGAVMGGHRDASKQPTAYSVTNTLYEMAWTTVPRVQAAIFIKWPPAVPSNQE